MIKSLSRSNVLTWMNELKQANPDFLFRGQNKEHNTISPSLFRQNKTKQLAVLKLCVEIHRYSVGITGYYLNNSLEEIGLLQHYLELSPMLDLTGTPEIALYFSLLNNSPDHPQIIYAFKQNDLKESGLEVVNHDFLLLPINQNGHKCRWLRQDGYGVCLKDWKDIESSRKFNLLNYKHQKFVFNASPVEMNTVKKLGNLLDVKEDGVAKRIFDVLHMLAEKLKIKKTLSQELNKYGFICPKESRDIYLKELLLTAKKKIIYVKELENLISGNNKNYWDDSFDASLEFYERKLQDFVQSDH